MVLLGCGPLPVFGQQSTADSLKNILSGNKKDTTAVVNLNVLALELIQNENYKEGVAYANQSLDLATELSFEKGRARALKSLGMAAYYQSDYLTVFDFWTRSLEAFEAASDLPGVANMTRNLGVLYYDQGSQDKALEYYFKSLEISEKIRDPLQITSNLVNIGGVYAQMKNYEKALAYYKKVEPYFFNLNNPGISSSYLMGVGEAHSLRNDHVNAKKYFEEALQINKNTPTYAHNLTMLGKEEFALGNTDKAIDYFDLAYRTAREGNLTLDEVQTLLAMGNLYQKTDGKKALDAYQKGEKLAMELELNEELRDIYKGMSVAYEGKGDFKNAYAYNNKYQAINDLIFNLETNDKIRGLQFDFDLNKKQDEIVLLEKEGEIKELEVKRQKNVIYGTIFSTFLLLLIAMGIFNRYKYVKKTNGIIEGEKEKSDNLLRNILPAETAEELKLNGKVAAKSFDSVTVFFSDFKGFTFYSQSLAPDVLVKSVDYYFSKFDQIIEKHGLEKIKTIGDAYMCAGGLPFPSEDHPNKMVAAALEIEAFVDETKRHKPEGITCFDIRIGINTGPIVAGVVGLKKFAYDIWGDTVNVASRMESMSDAGRINVSEYTYELIKDSYDCEFRGEIEVKNKGNMKMYFVNGPKVISLNQSEIERSKGLAPSLN